MVRSPLSPPPPISIHSYNGNVSNGFGDDIICSFSNNNNRTTSSNIITKHNELC